MYSIMHGKTFTSVNFRLHAGCVTLVMLWARHVDACHGNMLKPGQERVATLPTMAVTETLQTSDVLADLNDVQDVYQVNPQHRAEIHCTLGHDVLEPSESLMERNVLFNDALDTFYLRLYGVRP